MGMNMLQRRHLLFVFMFLVGNILSPMTPVIAAMTRTEAMKELGLSNSKFTDKELKTAYRNRSMQTHPDKERYVRCKNNEVFGDAGSSEHKKHRHRRKASTQAKQLIIQFCL